ncbi:periplasmic component of the Tol biopolymer transport system [Shewanella psychrophila]|uniref:Periplasmic component of the Tol biopolymer transport system n=1 Tax=Shewanella psychrophila TaxID=225848 RepID=A0A1S6HQA8_9GAMM|nr:winged helix-turn-helix domain-containing protein [Shewanella psychrophila]AQS37674.1 periplasmic component of the Tol biopolymer transport system [Shewanella psychrophila]
MIEIKKEAIFTLAGCVITPSDNSLNFKGCAVNIADNQELSSDKISLQPKFIELLSYLARKYPNVVTREELIENIWEGNVYVGTKALTNAIWHLRKQLNPLVCQQNDSRTPAIETVRKTGYRLLIEPEFSPADLVSQPEVLEIEQAKVQRLSHQLRKGRVVVIFSLFVITIAIFFHLYQDNKQLKKTELLQLTRAAGAELYPALSPDGRWLVYGKGKNLYLKDLQTPTNTPKRLTHKETSELRAIWTPDGKALIYPSRDVKSGECYMSLLRLDSHEVVNLTSCYNTSSALDISTDGSSLIYIWKGDSEEYSGLYQLDLTKKSVPQRISCSMNCDYRDRDVAFSPDGRWLAISRRFGNISEDIFIRDRSTGNEIRLTQGLEDIRGLSWHPDSNKLVFSTENSSTRSGYLIDIYSKELTNLSVPGFSYPKFAPNDTKLVFSNYVKDFKVAYLALDQAIPSTIFPLSNAEFSYRNPDYSRVNKRIVYVSNETGNNEIWTSDVNGTNRRQHTDLKRRVAYPSWSRDGSKIAFLAPDDKNEGNKVHVLDLENDGVSILASSYLDHRRPTWGANDEVVLSSTDDGLMAFSLSNKLPSNVTPLHIRLSKLIDGNKLIFTLVGKKGLWTLDLSKSDEIRELISVDDFDEDYNWVVTGKGVYFRDVHSKYQLINFWSFNTDLITPILKLPPNSLHPFGSMSYVPSEHRVLMTLSEYSKRDVMLLDHKLLH